jgi:hypothetical protein
MSAEVRYYAELLEGNQAQLHRDVVVDGEVQHELSGPIGEPAPLDIVQRFERVITADSTSRDIGDVGDALLLRSLARKEQQ